MSIISNLPRFKPFFRDDFLAVHQTECFRALRNLTLALYNTLEGPDHFVVLISIHELLADYCLGFIGFVKQVVTGIYSHLIINTNNIIYVYSPSNRHVVLILTRTDCVSELIVEGNEMTYDGLPLVDDARESLRVFLRANSYGESFIRRMASSSEETCFNFASHRKTALTELLNPNDGAESLLQWSL